MDWRVPFTYKTAGEVVFGVGASGQVGAKAKGLGAERVMVLTDPGVAKTGNLNCIVESLEAAGVKAGVWANVEPEPTAPSVDAAVDFFRQGDYPVLVAVGGGSTIDTAKSVATVATNGGRIMDYMSGTPITQPLLPVIGMPTTSGTGSECTNGAVITNPETHNKGGIGGPLVFIRMAIVDPMLASTMPPRVTANTGMDALVHAVESYMHPVFNPLIDDLSLGAIRRIGEWLRVAYSKGTDLEARTNMAYAAMAAGISIGNRSVLDAHGFAGPVATYLKQPHGVCVSVLLPEIMEWNAIACPEKFADIAEAMGEDCSGYTLREAAETGIDAVRQMMSDLGMPSTLREMGCTEDLLPTISEAAFRRGDRSKPPRPMAREDVYDLMKRVY